MIMAGDKAAESEAGAQAEEEFFETKVRPVIFDRCLDCHGREKSKGGLRLDSREAVLKGGESGPVVLPGKPDASRLIAAIRYDGDVQMPPKGKLKDEDIAALTEWVKLGRGGLWEVPAMQRVRQGIRVRRHPRVRRAGQRHHAATAIILVISAVARPGTACDQERCVACFRARPVYSCEARGGEAAGAEADKTSLIRRAYFDLIGLPPSPAEVAAYVDDTSAGAFARVVDRLLASPHHGERWGRYWLDVARYGEDQAHSFQPRLYPNGYRYRDWVVRALNRDVSYDRFVRDQIAGDLVEGEGAERVERLSALGFFACGPVYYGDAQRHDQYADRIDTLTRGFLGLTVACARCHDHKYDPIPTTDFYALEGVFASTEYVEVPAVPKEVVDAYKAGQAATGAKDKEINAFLKAEAERLKVKVSGNQFKAVESKLPEQARKKLAGLRSELEGLKKKSAAAVRRDPHAGRGCPSG